MKEISKKGRNLVWEIIFILLLLTNFLYFFGILEPIINTTGYESGLVKGFTPVYAFPLTLIDFIAVLAFILRKRPERLVVRILLDILLIVIGFVMIFTGAITFTFLGFVLWFRP